MVSGSLLFGIGRTDLISAPLKTQSQKPPAPSRQRPWQAPRPSCPCSRSSWRKPEEGYIEQTGDSPVISDNCGTRILPSSLSRWWTEDRAKCGLEGWCLHEFRHTYLTLLAIKGVHPKVMQELAGHYSSQISMDIYTHVNMDIKREAVAAVSEVF